MLVQQQQAIAHAMVLSASMTDKRFARFPLRSKVNSYWIARYCGLVGWAGFDYPSTSGWTSQSMKTIGVFDVFRSPKFGALPYAATVRAFTLEPSFYWDLEPTRASNYSLRLLGKEALVWSDADRVELSVDGGAFLLRLEPARGDWRFAHMPHPPFVADFTPFLAQRDTNANANGANAELMITGFWDKAATTRSKRFASDVALMRFQVTVDAKDGEVFHADGSDSARLVLQVVDGHGVATVVN